MTAKQELSVDFSQLILGFCSAALGCLGVDENPSGKNLSLARQNIDIIEMLRIKCQGNLSQDEDHLITEVLHDLRMKFVEASR